MLVAISSIAVEKYRNILHRFYIFKIITMSTNIDHSGIQTPEPFPPEPPAYESIDHTSVSQGISTIYLIGLYFNR